MDTVARVAKHGSPEMLHAAGRCLGLGQAERNAIKRDGVPRWVLMLLAASAGLLAGAAVESRVPGLLSRRQ